MADPSQKLNPRARSIVEGARSTGESVPVIVQLGATREIGTLHSTIANIPALTVTHRYSLIPSLAVNVDAAGVEQLALLPEVVQVWYDEPVHTMLDVSVPLIGAPQVWSDLGDQGEGITICLVDTGIDETHADFAGRIGLTRDFTIKGSVVDGNGHGTHVASIAAGSGAAENGKYKGVAPGATIMAAKVLNDQGGGRMSAVMAGVEWAAQNGAHIISLSLGSDGSSNGQDALSTICNAAVALGKVMVVAAGNSGPGERTIGSPGAAEQVITVAASSDTDQMADFSSRGPTADGRVKPDVTAPGVGIIAARAAGTLMGTPQGTFYTSASGTSMATPHVAGLCALLLKREPGLSPAQVKTRLQETARDLHSTPNTQGRGRIDAAAALKLIPVPTPTPTPEPTPNPTPVPTPNPPLGCLGSLMKLIGLV